MQDRMSGDRLDECIPYHPIDLCPGPRVPKTHQHWDSAAYVSQSAGTYEQDAFGLEVSWHAELDGRSRSSFIRTLADMIALWRSLASAFLTWEATVCLIAS